MKQQGKSIKYCKKHDVLHFTKKCKQCVGKPKRKKMTYAFLERVGG